MEGKINIGLNREINVGLHRSKRLLVICRFFTASELESRCATFPFTSICLDKGRVNALISTMEELKDKLMEMAMGMPLDDYKLDLGNGIYLTLDSTSYTVQIRRYWNSVEGWKPTRTGVAMNASEMGNLLKLVGDFRDQMADGCK